jgi:transcription initiation factor IIF auxiliary subunit
MPNDLKIEQWEQYDGDDWWHWAVWIEGEDETLDQIKFVEWTLHPTFPDPIRKTTNRSNKFRLETGGWGVFPIVARVELKDGKQTKLRHHLHLHYPDGQRTTK